MTRSLLRLPLAEIAAVLGIFFGVWLIHNTFQPASDTPNFMLLAVGALDILLCFGLLGYLLRCRLREGEALPRSWIVTGAVLIACFLGWIAALFIDSDRLLKEQQHHVEYLQQIDKLEDSLHYLSAVLPAENFAVDAAAWKLNHDRYAVVHDQLRTALRSRAGWDKSLTRIDEEVQQLARLFDQLLSPNGVEVRLKWRAEFAQSRQRAVAHAQSLRAEIAQAERDLAATHRARWHAVGASALTGVVLMFGCLLFWLLFDRALRRSWRAQSRLADDHARFRGLIENQAEPIAVLTPAGTIAYANPAWKTKFGYERDEILGRDLLEMIHPADRPRVLSALKACDVHAIPCRLSADYGVWHDVEMQCQAHEDAGASVVRFHDVRETPDVPILPQPELLTDDRLKAAETRMADLERENADLRDREGKAQGELEHHRWLAGLHTQANSDGVLILSARGDVVSWNPAFVRLWKLSNDTMSGHTWQTIAAHMESQVNAGWDDFDRAARHRRDSAWEMTLEGGRTFEVYAQASPRPQGDGLAANAGAMQFHFRDVTRHKDLESQLHDHAEQARQLQTRLDELEEQKREREKRLKQLDKQLREREQHREELETTLRDHQDRLHQMHETHEAHAASLKSARESLRRLAAGVANDFDNILSVVLGNTEVLRDNLPLDHVAQNYLTDIHGAASRGAELSQRLIAFSRQHLLQMAPVEMNHQLDALEPKIRIALGHVQLHWQRGDDELWIKTDAHPLEQALLHVVTHAKAHMPAGGTLTIIAERVQLSRRDLTHADMAPGPYIQITLQDTGTAIDDDKLAHVFEPYQPLVAGQKGDLTLATAHAILRQSGGCIEVASVNGQGTTWTLLLPETQERPQQTGLRASA